MLKISDFNIDPNLIDIDISKYREYVEKTRSKRSLNNIKKNYLSVDDFVIILYWLRFKEKMTYEEIGELIYLNSATPATAAYKDYLSIGWNYSINFQENEQLAENEREELNAIKEESFTLDIENYISKDNFKEYAKLLNKAKKNLSEDRIEHTYIKLGYSSIEHYFNACYYFVKVKKLSTTQISKIFAIHPTQIHRRLLKLGLNIDFNTAQKNASSEGRRNYSSIIHTGRKTINDLQLKNGQFGGITENLIRNRLSSCLVEYISLNQYEVIVGINNHNIIPPKEVDIPLVIINPIKGTYFKFAIEVNGEVFHADKEKDNLKLQELLYKDWVLFTIWVFSSTKKQKNYGTIETQINEICKSISILIEE